MGLLQKLTLHFPSIKTQIGRIIPFIATEKMAVLRGTATRRLWKTAMESRWLRKTRLTTERLMVKAGVYWHFVFPRDLMRFLHSKNKTPFRKMLNLFLVWNQSGGARILVILQDLPMFSHILQKVSARALHWCGWTSGWTLVYLGKSPKWVLPPFYF